MARCRRLERRPSDGGRRSAAGRARPEPSRRSRTSPRSATNCKPINTSPCNCSGRSIARSTRTATATAASVICTSAGCGGRKSCCGRSTAPARSCLSTTPATPFRCTIRLAASSRRGGDLRGGAGGQQLHLCRGHLDAGPGRLDRLAYARLRVFRGVPEIVVPDNLKSGVTKACRYEPSVNRPTRRWPRTTAWP